MANLFEGFDGPPATSTDPGTGGNLFDGFAPVVPDQPSGARSYLGASVKAAGQNLAAMGAGLVAGSLETNPAVAAGVPATMARQAAVTAAGLPGLDGVASSKRALLEQFKNDPKGFEVAWGSPIYAAHRMAENRANAAAATMTNLTEQGKAVAGQSYDPFSDKPSAGLERLGGDILQSAPSVIGTAASVALATRSPVAGATVGGVIEGTLDATGQRQQVRQQLDAVPPEKWAAVPEYQKLIADKWHPDMARKYLIEQASLQSSIETGVASGLIAALGGHVLGRVVQGTNAGPIGRAVSGFATEAPVEALQSGAQQVSSNLAERRTTNPDQSLWEGTREQLFQGGFIGGVMGGTLSAAAGRRQRVLDHNAATSIIGANPDTVPNDRPLPPISARIVEVAKAAGVDPGTALMTASMESGFDPSAVNSIGATGLFQFLDGAMRQYGVTREQLLANPDLQIEVGVRMLADAGKVVRDTVGRDPLPHEIYMAQLFGHGGVRTWLAADPAANALDTVKKYTSDDALARATLTQNGFTTDMTVGQVVDILRTKAAAHYGRVGGGEYPIGPDLSQFRSRQMSDVDPLIDAELLRDEAIPPAAQDAIDTAATSQEVGRSGDNVETLNAVREPIGQSAEPIAPQTWVRPAELQPRGLRWNQFDLKFSDPLAESLYVASSKHKSSAVEAHIAWLTNEVGMQQEEIDRLGTMVRQKIANAGRQAEKIGGLGSINIPSLAEMDSAQQARPDTTISEESLATRQGTPNPNHALARENRPVIFGPGPGDGNGAALRTHELKPGQVVTAALPSDHASPGYMKAVHGTVQKLISTFAPSARVVILHETRTDATASYNKVGDGFYVIMPRNLTRIENQGAGKYNLTARLQAGFSLLHEVGHVIVDHSFMRGLSESQRSAINTLPAEGYFEEAFLKSLPKDQAAILREYNAKKRALLEDPKATAEDFVKAWMSPWKIAHGLGQGAVQGGARRWISKYFGEGTARRSARDFALEAHGRWDTLSVHEYLAEQFARYGYKKSLLNDTVLGATEWFKQTLDWLKRAFQSAKMDKVIGPLTNFDKWLQQLSTVAKPARGAAKPIPKLTMAGARFDGPIDSVTRDKVMFDRSLPEAVQQQAVELVHYGQPETAREVVENHTSKMEVTRWDGDMPEFAGPDEAMRNLGKIPSIRKATEKWIATGARLREQLRAAVLDIRQKAAANLDVSGLTYIDSMLSSMKAYSGNLQTRAKAIALDWAASSRVQDGRMQELMRLEVESGRHLAQLGMVNGHMEFVKTPEFIEAAAKAGLDDRQAQLMLTIKSEYVRRMNTLQAALRRSLMEKMADALPERRPYYSEQIRRLAQAFKAIRETPFMPQTRFGNHFVEVKQGNRVVHVESFESANARDEAMLKLRKATKGYTIVPFDVDSRVAVLRVLPPEVLDDVGFEGTLTPRQRAALMRTLDPATANPKARKYSPELAKITGASRDGLRMFADFMHNDALLLSKMAFKSEFDAGLERIEEDLRQARAQGDLAQSDRLQAILNGARQNVSQILNPAAEWHAFRSFVVFHDLWGRISSAVANLNDVIKPWASVSRRLGDLAGGKVFGKSAYDSAAQMIVNGMQQVAGGPPRQWTGLNFEERAAMDRAQAEGHIDETYAAALSGMASGGVLQRMGMGTVSRTLDTAMRLGMKPFQVMEMFTRRVAFLTSFRSLRILGLPQDEAYRLAIQDLNIQSGDNSIQNRSTLMRGKKGIALIYYNYMRSTLWAMNGGMAEVRRQREAHGILPPSRGYGNESARMWAATLFIGGLMGLPGAEDADKLLEVASRQLFGQRFSLREYAFEFAGLLADNARAMGIDITPRSFVHGASTDLLGFDLSGSLSFGNALPGLGGIDSLGKRDDTKVLLGLAGPTGRRAKEVLDLFNEGLPWDKRLAIGIPAAAQAIGRGLEDEPRFFSGARVLVDPRTGELKRLDTGDRLGMMMGFNPTDIAARKELAFTQREFTQYWSAKRNVVLAQYWEARLQRNQDAIHDAMKEVQHFNSIVPVRDMALTADTIERSMSARARNMQREERAQAASRSHQPRYSELTRLVLGEGTR